jgi:uncharacterized protein YceK
MKERRMKKIFKSLIISVAVIAIMSGCASMTLVSLESDTVEGPRQIRQGENIDPKTITVWGLYKDESRKVVNINASHIIFDKNITGRQTVRVRVGSQETSFQTEVMALLSLSIVSPPGTTVFKLGQDAGSSWPGLVVQGEWDQMGNYGISLASCQITGYNKDQVGRQSIRVSYMGKSASFDVDVRPMTGLQIAQPPTKLDYLQGDSLDLGGIRVMGVWEGLPAEQINVSAGNVTGFNPDRPGVQSLTLTINGRSASFNIEVLRLTGIVLDKPPNKTDYRLGEQLDLTGIIVNGNYVGSTPAKRKTELIPVAKLVVTGYNPNTIGKQQRVSVAVGDYIANFFVNVDLPDPSANTAPQAGSPPQTGTPSQLVQTTTPSTGPMTWKAASGLFSANAIAYGNGRWIAVGDGSNIAYSDNGVNWTAVERRNNPVSGSYQGIAYGNGRWIAFGNTGLIYSDDNGVNWTKPDTGSLFSGSVTCSVAWGNGRWVAASSGNKMAYSDNGAYWTAVDASGIFGTNAINSIAWGNGRWVACGLNGKMAYSDSGVNWTAVNVSGIFGDRPIRSIAYGNGRWIAGGSFVSSDMAYSDNGVNWTKVDLPFSSEISIGLRAVAYGNGRWIAAATSKLAYSSNGVNWTPVTTSTFGDKYIYGLAYGNGRWVAAGAGMAYSDN